MGEQSLQKLLGLGEMSCSITLDQGNRTGQNRTITGQYPGDILIGREAAAARWRHTAATTLVGQTIVATRYAAYDRDGEDLVTR